MSDQECTATNHWHGRVTVRLSTCRIPWYRRKEWLAIHCFGIVVVFACNVLLLTLPLVILSAGAWVPYLVERFAP